MKKFSIPKYVARYAFSMFLKMIIRVELTANLNRILFITCQRQAPRDKKKRFSSRVLTAYFSMA